MSPEKVMQENVLHRFSTYRCHCNTLHTRIAYLPSAGV